jgi:predicted transposase/invertase (TIGR01784 family)
MNVNRKFKDSVFTMLFSEPDLLRELYCALDGVSLPPDAPVSINTLEDVLFMEFINDISFEIDGKLVVLIEHQSTINQNIALRLLMYIARVYEKTLEGKNIYSGKRLTVPQPEFFVLYNGTSPCEDQQIIRLSASFEKLKTLGLAEKDAPALELVVKVLNINEGRNKEIAARCKKLAEYSAFIAKVRDFERELGSKEEAVKSAIKFCGKHDILNEFLKLHAGEVLSMLMTEWNMEDALAVRYDEGLEQGHEERTLIIARNALAEGATFEFIQKITGLDLETIRELRN